MLLTVVIFVIIYIISFKEYTPMEKSKDRIKLFVIIAILFVFSLVFIFILFRNSNNIKIGMNKDKALSILEKDKYHYEINGSNDKPIIFVNNVILNNIEGSLYIHVNSNNRIAQVVFSTSTEQLNKKIDILNKYLTELYNSPEYDESLSKALGVEYYSFYKNNMVIVFEYPNNLNCNQKNISICWSYKNDNE